MTPPRALGFAAMLSGFALVEILLIAFVDKPLALYTHGLDATHHDLIDFFRSITDSGQSIWYLWPCGIVAIIGAFLSRAQDAPAFLRRLSAFVGAHGFFLFVPIALSGIIADILKAVIGRARPVEFMRDNIYAFHPLTAAGFAWNSMPSGHATTAFALGCALSALYPRGRVLWLTLATGIAASRVMVDAHYLSDVCAGAALGWATVCLLRRYGIFQLTRVIFPIDRSRPSF